MYKLATASNIKVLVGRPLPIGPGDLSDQLSVESPVFVPCMFAYLDRDLVLGQGQPGFENVVFLEYDVVLEGKAGQATWKTVNGIDPDADGYGAMTPLVLDAVTAFGVRGIK
jgi:hypothetical protein